MVAGGMSLVIVISNGMWVRVITRKIAPRIEFAVSTTIVGVFAHLLVFRMVIRLMPTCGTS